MGFSSYHRWFCLFSAIAGVWKQSGFSAFQRQAIGISILIWMAGMFFLALLSIQFDFGNSTGPSRVHPYFTAGRLLSGALIPFALMYVYGIAFLLRRAKRPSCQLSIVVGIVAVSAVSEIVAHRGVSQRTQLVSSLTHAGAAKTILLAASLLLIVVAVRGPLLPIPLERDEGE